MIERKFDILKMMVMMLSKTSSSKKNSPKKIAPGTYLVVHIIKEKNGKIVFEPLNTIKKDQMWFWTPRWQKREKEADKALAQGKIFGPFTSAKDLLQSLKS